MFAQHTPIKQVARGGRDVEAGLPAASATAASSAKSRASRVRDMELVLPLAVAASAFPPDAT